MRIIAKLLKKCENFYNFFANVFTNIYCVLTVCSFLIESKGSMYNNKSVSEILLTSISFCLFVY